MQDERVDVLVLGAGVAGLAAAQVLSQAGLYVILIEARDRMGGRVFTKHVPGYPLPIELGAEFIHGRPPESFTLVERADLFVYETDGEHWLARDGRLAPNDVRWERTQQVFDQMSSIGANDQSLYRFLMRFQGDAAWRDAAAMAASYVEGFDAADPHTVSVHALMHEQRAATSIDGDRVYRFARGYDTLVAALADQCESSRTTFYLNTVAQRVIWRRGHVEIKTANTRGGDSRHFTARCAVITLPLGVWHAPAGAHGAVTFEPTLADHADAARHLAMGQVVKLTLRFRERFWEYASLPLESDEMDPRQISFLFDRDAVLPTWWTAYPVLAPQLTAWAGGPAAERLIAQPEQVIRAEAIETLSRVLGIARNHIEDQLIDTHMHDWRDDPYARGAYSYIKVGGMDAVRTFATPAENTLFFAGEATNNDGHIGTVHGAITIGRRAANEVLKSRDTSRD